MINNENLKNRNTYLNKLIAFQDKEVIKVVTEIRREVIDANGVSYSLKEAFEEYLRFDGMPGIIDVGLEQEKAFMLLEGIYSTIITRDILEIKKEETEK